MIPDADIQVWLDTQFNAGHTIVVPYVQSSRTGRLGYHIELIQRGSAGASRISQQGQVDLSAGEAASLSRLAVDARTQGECRMEIVLREEAKEIGVFRFDCAPRD